MNFEEFLEELIEDAKTGVQKKVHRANPNHPNFHANVAAGHTAPGTPVEGHVIVPAPLTPVAPGATVVPTPAATTTTTTS